MAKDKKPKVRGYFLCEFKPLFSVVLLHFQPGSREAYHTHAFNAVSWLFCGQLHEHTRPDDGLTILRPSLLPVITRRNRFHKVFSVGHTWALSFRGPWVDRWKEFRSDEDREVTLTHGRIEV